MTDENYDTAVYHPDANAARRKEVADAKPKPAMTVDKPISFRVGKTKPGSYKPHYPRKAKKFSRPDLRNPTYY